MPAADLSADERKTAPPAQEMTYLGIGLVALLLALFYGGTLIMSMAISRKK